MGDSFSALRALIDQVPAATGEEEGKSLRRELNKHDRTLITTTLLEV